jgi:hypothetical protein
MSIDREVRRRSFLLGTGAAVATVAIARPAQAAQSAQLVSQGKPATASAADTGHDPGYANDGDPSNNAYWGAPLSPAGNAWWQVDLQNTYRVSQVNVRNWVDGTRYYQYQVRGSLDGINFFPLGLKASGSTATDAGDPFPVDAVVRYVRIDLYHNSANSEVHLTDVRVYGAPVAVAADPVQVRCEIAPGGLIVPGQQAKVVCTLTNTGKTTVRLSRVTAATAGLTDPLASQGSIVLANTISLRPEESRLITGAVQAITTATVSGAYAVYVGYMADIPRMAIASFFRAGASGELTTAVTRRFSYKKIPVYALDGGLSTEFNIEKSAESLTAGVSHSWYLQEGGVGEPPVWGTPHFLRDSIRTTVDFYDDVLGRRSEIDTVIVGIFSDGHIPRALGAVWLPAHFLVTTTTLQEVASMLDQSAVDGYPATATSGPDGSVPGYVASWINFTNMPAEYAEFIKRHNVKNVVLVGGDGQPAWGAVSGGVNQVLRDGTVHSSRKPGDIIVLPALGPLDAWAKDYADWPISDAVDAADWEVAFVKEAIPGIAAGAKAAGARVTLVAGDGNEDMFEIESAATLAFMKKNERVFTNDGKQSAIQGIVTNTYLLSHPFYESRIGYVPFYLGSFTLADSVDVRLMQHLSAYIEHYFGPMDITKLPLWFDAARDMDAVDTVPTFVPYLKQKGFSVWTLDYSGDEVWDPTDGMNAPVELIAQRLAALSSAANLRAWNDSLAPIDIADLHELAAIVPGLTVTEL